MSTPNKKTRSEAQSEASRTNGSKSQGPVTEQGKERICMNRMTHGFRSNVITLSTEDKPAYDHHLDSYLIRYAPKDKTEEDLVGLLASSMWQIMRNNSIEVALFELEIAGVAANLDERIRHIDQYGLLALAFKKSAGDNAFELLRRYKSTSERAFHRALEALEQIQKNHQGKSTVQTQEDQSTVADPIEPQQKKSQPEPRKPLVLIPQPEKASQPEEEAAPTPPEDPTA